MPSAVKAVAVDFPELSPGDQVIVNDPYRGGSHLPDITLIAPFFREGKLKGYAVNRAHHADVGGDTPGSMPGSSSTLYEEGIVISPVLFVKRGVIQDHVRAVFEKETRNPAERIGDLNAQVGANRLGVSRCIDFISRYGERAFDQFIEAIIDYAKSRVTARLFDLPDGEAEAIEYLDGEDNPVPIRVKIRLQGGGFYRHGPPEQGKCQHTPERNQISGILCAQVPSASGHPAKPRVLRKCAGDST
jgi:N-methylhydantoinase B